ncbi:MAG: hypothetical protein M2R45_05434 [Verrucomicrobia subdivision 3 bacterium]|nr:hypothetical protein [Limisphaerales bacterium]
MNENVFKKLDHFKDEVEELTNRTLPDEQSVPGATLHQHLKTIHQKLARIETAIFLRLPKETQERPTSRTQRAVPVSTRHCRLAPLLNPPVPKIYSQLTPCSHNGRPKQRMIAALQDAAA